MQAKDIRPIPKAMLKSLRALDRKNRRDRGTLFYAYFTHFGGELAKVTVATKVHGVQWYCKQVAVHGIHSDTCFVRDMEYAYLGGFRVGWHAEGLYRNAKWYEGNGWCTAPDSSYDPFATLVNVAYIAALPAYRYSAIQHYDAPDTFAYLRLYEKYPQGEMLIKLGLGMYAASVQILRKTGKDKAFRKWLIRNRDTLACGSFYVGTLLKAYKTGEDPRKVQQLEKDRKRFLASDCYRELKPLFGNDTERLLRYLREQGICLSTYADYVRACLFLGLDMSLPKNRYPHDFRHWHDIRTDEYRTAKALRDEEERKALFEKFALVAEKYLPLQRDMQDGFVVMIARSPADLIREGDALCHCVGHMNYDLRFIREESLIFFIRDRKTPDVPFVTVEYSLKDKNILQCYGAHNTRPADEVLDFIRRKWLPYANRKLKTIAAA